jgi:FkbM family methyltransferase
MSYPLKKFDVADARRWKPFVSGPQEQWLKCEGSLVARIVSALHFSWPSDRGQWRMNHMLRRNPLKNALRQVPFRSTCGVRILLDIPTDRFLYLSGRLSSEPLELAVTIRLVRPGDVFVDVGAHLGLYVLHVLGRIGPSGKYFALEPGAENVRFLNEAFPDPDNRFEVLEIAASDKDGQSRLTGANLNAHLDDSDSSGSVVQTSRLDTILRNVPLANRGLVIKVDTEGHEAAVIRGSAGLAKLGIRPMWILEFLPERFQQSRHDVLSAIHEAYGASYLFWALDTRKACLVKFTDPGTLGDDVRNILAMPAERIDRISDCPQSSFDS